MIYVFFDYFWTPGLSDGVHGPRVYLMGSMVIALVRRSVGPSVRSILSVRLSLNILETAHSIFLKLCMKLGVNKVKKVTRPEF